jgi:FAD/FMN-containing dehydrogenase
VRPTHVGAWAETYEQLSAAEAAAQHQRRRSQHRRHVDRRRRLTIDRWTADAYGKNFDRLQRIKAAYDPDNLFRVNRNISPTT